MLITHIMKFLSEMPKGVSMSHAKYFRNQTCGFLVIKLFRLKIMTSQTELITGLSIGKKKKKINFSSAECLEG